MSKECKHCNKRKWIRYYPDLMEDEIPFNFTMLFSTMIPCICNTMNISQMQRNAIKQQKKIDKFWIETSKLTDNEIKTKVMSAQDNKPEEIPINKMPLTFINALMIVKANLLRRYSGTDIDISLGKAIKRIEFEINTSKKTNVPEERKK